MKIKRNILYFAGSGLLIAASRVIPHADNFTPMESLVLFGAFFYTARILAFIMPLVLMYVFDFIINNTIARPFFTEHDGLVLFSDYMLYNGLSYILIALTGLYLLNRLKLTNVLSGSVLSAGIFFLITNFGSWLGSAMYPQTAEGLWMSYIAGLPFLKSTMISTILFSVVFYTAVRIYEKLIIKSVVIDQPKQ